MVVNTNQMITAIQSVRKDTFSFIEQMKALVITLEEMGFSKEQIDESEKKFQLMKIKNNTLPGTPNIVNTPCLKCKKHPRYDYNGYCLDCADELKISELATQAKKINKAAEALENLGRASFKDMIEVAFPERHKEVLVNISKNLQKMLLNKLGDNDEEWIYKIYQIPDNAPLRGYQAWINLFNVTFKAEFSDNGLQKFTEDLEKIVLYDAKIFEVEDSVAKVLSLTDAPQTKLPFDNLFLDGKFKIDDKLYHGIFVFQTQDEKNEIKFAIASVYSSRAETGDFGFQIQFNRLDNDFQVNELPDSWNYNAKLSSLVYAFANFINNPEVKFFEIERSESNNKRRMKDGKICIPQKNMKITLYGELKRYIEEFKYTSIKNKASHRFWVRGHFFHLRKRDAFKRLYSLEDKKLKELDYNIVDGIIVGWKKPHISGKGILINKSYIVKK
jgi:hypothetical protein